eukprot:1957999-Amphidinium_carterae.1
MRSHQTAQQAEAAGLPAAYLTGNAEADLLAGSAVQDVPPVPTELGLFRGAAAAARSFWSLFASACPKEHLVKEDQVSQGRQPNFSRVAQFFSRRAADTSSDARKSAFYTHLAGEDESSQMLVEGTASPSDVRVDDSMDRRVPVVEESPAAVATQLHAGGEDQDMAALVYRVGPHLCRLTNGDTRITCTKCERYVTTYK